MKRIIPPVHEPKAGQPKTRMSDLLQFFVTGRPQWQASRDRNKHLGELLDELDRAPDGPWDLTDKAVESLLTEMQGVQAVHSDQPRVAPMFLRFWTSCLEAVFGAEDAPDEKPRAERANGKSADTGTAGAQA
jgi:hypothetical protein